MLLILNSLSVLSDVILAISGLWSYFESSSTPALYTNANVILIGGIFAEVALLVVWLLYFGSIFFILHEKPVGMPYGFYLLAANLVVYGAWVVFTP